MMTSSVHQCSFGNKEDNGDSEQVLDATVFVVGELFSSQ